MPTSAFTIRGARASDAGDVARLTVQLGYELAEAEAHARLTRILARDQEQFLVADVSGQAVGWVHAVIAEYVDVERFGLIAGLVVDRDNRQSGIGRALMAGAESWTRDQGCSVVRLTSSATRTSAHRFYEGIGYVNLKTQYSFIKPLDDAAAERLQAFVPRVDS